MLEKMDSKANLTECSVLPQLEMMRDLVEFYGTLKHEGRGTTSGFLHDPALELCISYFCISVAIVSGRNNLKQQHFVLDHSVGVLQSIVVAKARQQGQLSSQKAGRSTWQGLFTSQRTKSIKTNSGTRNWVWLSKAGHFTVLLLARSLLLKPSEPIKVETGCGEPFRVQPYHPFPLTDLGRMSKEVY